MFFLDFYCFRVPGQIKEHMIHLFQNLDTLLTKVRSKRKHLF